MQEATKIVTASGYSASVFSKDLNIAPNLSKAPAGSNPAFISIMPTIYPLGLYIVTSGSEEK